MLSEELHSRAKSTSAYVITFAAEGSTRVIVIVTEKQPITLRRSLWSRKLTL